MFRHQGPVTYTWDAQNRLTQINGPHGSAAFQYDAQGRRIEKTVNGQTTSYLYSGHQAIAELQGSAIGATYLTGLQIDEVLARYSNKGNRSLLTDALGSIISQSDDTQTGQTLYGYSPYGEQTQVGENNANSLQYTGRENDNTGLYYYRARYYDPQLKRFISSDPIGLAGGLNRYGYVFNNPLRWTDPTGLGKWDKLYGWPKEFWNWLHREDGGKLIKELKDPSTKQVPKDVAEPYFEEWKQLQKNKDQGGFIDPDLLPSLLTPWWLTPGELGTHPCELPGGPPCGPTPPDKPKECG